MSAYSETVKRSKGTLAAVACDGKVGFVSYEKAAAVLKRYSVKDRPGRTAYHCGHCQQWHLGTDKGRVEKKRAADFKERKYHV